MSYGMQKDENVDRSALAFRRQQMRAVMFLSVPIEFGASSKRYREDKALEPWDDLAKWRTRFWLAKALPFPETARTLETITVFGSIDAWLFDATFRPSAFPAEKTTLTL